MGEQKLIEKVVQQGDKKITYNIGDKRSFSETKWKKNLGKLRAEQFSFYPLLNEGEERSDESAASPSDQRERRVNLKSVNQRSECDTSRQTIKGQT